MNFFQWLFGIKPKKKEKPKSIYASGRYENRKRLSNEINQGYLDPSPALEADPFGIHYVDNVDNSGHGVVIGSSDGFNGFGGGSGGGGGATSSWADNSSSFDSSDSGGCDSGGGDGGVGGGGD